MHVHFTWFVLLHCLWMNKKDWDHAKPNSLEFSFPLFIYFFFLFVNIRLFYNRRFVTKISFLTLSFFSPSLFNHPPVLPHPFAPSMAIPLRKYSYVSFQITLSFSKSSPFVQLLTHITFFSFLFFKYTIHCLSHCPFRFSSRKKGPDLSFYQIALLVPPTTAHRHTKDLPPSTLSYVTALFCSFASQLPFFSTYTQVSPPPLFIVPIPFL
ncbi:hypothetical protein BKA57DRAFT_183995 [Linnemannia elongata]|nr:hypothetical protein BKA57DRAFT_183995 [Linnemannia elongata]